MFYEMEADEKSNSRTSGGQRTQFIDVEGGLGWWELGSFETTW